MGSPVSTGEWDTLTDEQRRVLDWRQEMLEGLGVSSEFAEVMAAAAHVDIHRAAELKAAGATEDQIIKILL